RACWPFRLFHPYPPSTSLRGEVQRKEDLWAGCAHLVSARPVAATAGARSMKEFEGLYKGRTTVDGERQAEGLLGADDGNVRGYGGSMRSSGRCWWWICCWRPCWRRPPAGRKRLGGHGWGLRQHLLAHPES